MSAGEVLERLESVMNQVDQLLHWTSERQPAYGDSGLGMEQENLMVTTAGGWLSQVRDYLKQAALAMAGWDVRDSPVGGGDGPECP
jgi:hypothetical protein